MYVSVVHINSFIYFLLQRHARYVDKIDACHIYYFLLTIGMIVLTFTGTFVKVSCISFVKTHLPYNLMYVEH